MILEWWQYLLLSLAGAAAGFIDAIAGGGGLISVPALLWAGLPPQVALGTNKLQSSCGTLLAVAHYTRAGLIQWRSLRPAVVVTFIAATGGAWAVVSLFRKARGDAPNALRMVLLNKCKSGIPTAMATDFMGSVDSLSKCSARSMRR